MIVPNNLCKQENRSSESAPVQAAVSSKKDARRQALRELAVLFAVMLWVLWTDSKQLMPWAARAAGSTTLVAVVVGLLVRQRPSREEWGLAPKSWTDGLASLALFTGVGVAMLACLGASLGAIGLPENFGLWIMRNWYLELAQQIVLQVLFVPRLQILLDREGMIVSVVAAVAFSLLHAPNLPLMSLTLVAAVVWCEWFRRFRNLPIVWLSHFCLGASALWLLNIPTLGMMRVGIAYILRRT